jgi:hypothetical protein
MATAYDIMVANYAFTHAAADVAQITISPGNWVPQRHVPGTPNQWYYTNRNSGDVRISPKPANRKTINKGNYVEHKPSTPVYTNVRDCHIDNSLRAIYALVRQHGVKAYILAHAIWVKNWCISLVGRNTIQ